MLFITVSVIQPRRYRKNKSCILSALCKHKTYKCNVGEERSATCTREG